MTLPEAIAAGASVSGILFFLWRIDEGNRNKVSGRSFNEYKDEARKEFVSKESCGYLRKPMEKALETIQKDIKELLRRKHGGEEWR